MDISNWLEFKTRSSNNSTELSQIHGNWTDGAKLFRTSEDVFDFFILSFEQ